MDPVVITTSVDLAASAKDVWPLITDTDRMNRLIGGQPVTFRAIEAGSDSPARFVAETTASGFKIEYEEYPFEWVHERSFSVYRKMRRGIISSYALRIELEPRGELGTRVRYRLELMPIAWIFRPVASIVGRRFVTATASLTGAIDSYVRDKAPNPYLKPASEPNVGAVEFGFAALKKAGIEPELARKVADYVRSAADADVLRMRPFELAEDWKVDRRDVLRAFLHAVPAGLVELRWALVCPSCRTASQQVTALEDVALEGHCQLCDISFDLDLDRAVEATFVVHPGIRDVPDRMFCIGGPARTPHVLVQLNVNPGETRDADGPNGVARYRVFARGGASSSLEVEAGGPASVSVEIGKEGVTPPHVKLGPRGVLSVTNATGEARHVKIEGLGYATQAATAHAVSTLPEFRALFSRDLLKRGTPLKVARVAVLFSDLTGSTALYSKVGDAAAFRLVDDHFDLLRRVIGERRGIVVKTMGDAVMAAFPDPSDCVEAAIGALAEFETFRAGHKHGDDVGIKLGMFVGACYVVTANGQLDYFGQTVNVASRVQHLAESGQLVVETSVADGLRPETRALVEAGERFDARVKGVDGPLALVRLGLSPESMNRITRARSA